MTLQTRRIIMLSFIFAFFILAPIILFYASGYRLDLTRYKILKTGTLFIEAKDISKADLYLNNKKLPEQFTSKKYIYNLLPGEYDIKLSKTGYHDWGKKAAIYSGLTTFIQDAILFKNEVPLQIINNRILNFYPAPDWSKIVYIIKNNNFLEIYFYNLNDKQKILIYRLADANQALNIEWAPSSNKILLSYDKNFLIIDSQNPENISNFSNLIKLSPEKAVWDIQSDNLLYTEAQNSIYKINLLAKTSDKILTVANNQLNQAFFIEANDIYYIEQAENQNTLMKYNQNFKTTKKATSLSKSNSYKFIQSTNDYLSLIDLDLQKLYLIKKTNLDSETDINASEQIKEFKAKDAIWADNQKQLLYYDDFEISDFNTDENKEQFINRYGQTISKILWYPDLEHFVMLIDNQLKIIDTTQEVGTRNTTDLVKFDQISNFYLDQAGANIYFDGQIGKQQGLYQLKLK
jgi:hypothetical protein